MSVENIGSNLNNTTQKKMLFLSSIIGKISQMLSLSTIFNALRACLICEFKQQFLMFKY